MYKMREKIRIICMKGEDHYNGREGIIEYIDGIDQLHGTWGGLAVMPEQDTIEVISDDTETR